MNTPLSIYVHIPFCVKKCAYCDFLSASADSETRQKYVDSLIREIIYEAARYPDRRVETVFFGGGTPTCLSAAQLEKILAAIQTHFHMAPKDELEITTECNPGTVNLSYLKSLKAAGFNRISIGLQSTNDEELRRLGRIHDYQTFLETWAAVREAGFENANIDLMSALPGQTLESYQDTLEKVVALAPEHLSAYSLILEEGTPFYERYSEHREELPDEEQDRRMYEFTEKILAGHGYERYEISNYAKPGKACRHNQVYWERGDYLGLGLGASSLIQNKRWRLTDSLQEYVEKGTFTPLDVEELTLSDQMEEFMFLGLRERKGVSKKRFETLFGHSMEEIYGDVLHKYESLKLLKTQGDCLLLTSAGIDVSNTIFADFMLT